MLPALRLLLVTLGVLLISSSAAQAAAKTLAVPAEGQVAVTFASGVKRVKVQSAPAGVTVAGGVKSGKLAVAVVRPRGAANGKVVLQLTGKVKGFKTVAAALDGGKAPSCSGLDKLLAKRLKGTADAKGLAGVLAAKLCGKPAPANAAAILTQLGLGAAPTPPAPSGPSAGPASGGRLQPPAPHSTPTPAPPAGKACGNGADDDNDGQTDLEDPGCADGNDTSEDSEVTVTAACSTNSGVGMGDDPTWLGAGINDCGPFTKVRIDVAPGIVGCDIVTGGPKWTCTAGIGTGPAIDTADVNLKLTGAVNCARPATIVLYRPSGEVAELRGPVARCGAGGAPACANGKDDDGDGMIDDHFADGATDPDPGCTSSTDTSEDSELPALSGCTISIGIWDEQAKLAGAMTQGCGAIQGFWFRGPSTVLDCAYKLGAAAGETCQKVGRTGGTMFAATPLDLRVAVELGQAVQCEPMTLALIRADNSVIAARGTLDGC
ncbi:hypothetical protein OJ998_18920 [Solirubrobacter taibaiensis]|nr:hypothetical protein [Solirubrobacter taibaiensis]